MGKKRLVIGLMLLILAAEVFAATYVIKSYSFDVKGKTKGFVLREAIGDPGEEEFSSEDELVSFLNDKRQILNNKRQFLETGYTYETVLSGPDRYDVHVTFHITDAKTFIVIPFPKYDSNYGMSLKLKAKDINFMGTFTSLNVDVEFTQRENSFKEGYFNWNASLDDFRLGEAKISLNQYGTIDLQNWGSSNTGFGSSVSNIKIGDVALMNGSFSFKFAPVSAERESKWGLHTISGSLGASFLKESMNSASISTGVTYTLPTKLFSTTNSFSYHIANGFYSSSVLYTQQFLNEAQLNWIRVGTGVNKGFTLFNRISFSPNLMLYVDYTFPSEYFNPFAQLSLPFSYNTINWVDNNFRKGLSFSLTAVDTFYPLYEQQKNYISLTGSFEAHYPVAAWFNPSARLNFILANSLQTINYGDAYSWNMRGIRNDNEIINKSRKFGMTMNLDLMVNFIRIEGFCSTYAIPFIDVFVGSNGRNDFDKLITVGGEGIIIVDSHPSYPIRGSLGFNALDLIKWMRGEIGLVDVEFELFIGLYFFY